MRGEFVDLDGVRLYCYAFGQRGTGHPIVLVHGSFTSSHLWQDVLPRLPKGHRVLVLDLLGHGRSDPPGSASMTVAAHAERLERLLDIMGVQEVMLVGHGMGAAVAARVAHEHPERIAQLMLVNPTLLAARANEALLNRKVRRVAALAWLWQRLAPSWVASALHAALLPCFAHRDVGARPASSSAHWGSRAATPWRRLPPERCAAPPHSCWGNTIRFSMPRVVSGSWGGSAPPPATPWTCTPCPAWPTWLPRKRPTDSAPSWASSLPADPPSPAL
jgi:pimeloyl-ACP methyl ester carboxylesterase